MSSVANDTDVKALLHYSFRSKYVYLKQFSAKLTHYIKKKKKNPISFGVCKEQFIPRDNESALRPKNFQNFQIWTMIEIWTLEGWKGAVRHQDTWAMSKCPLTISKDGDSTTSLPAIVFVQQHSNYV